MASDFTFVQFVCDQIDRAGIISYRKMFGEYMVYCNDKPLVLICDNTAFVKMRDEIKDLMEGAQTGHPYDGAKLHYILDVDNQEFATMIVKTLEKITDYPKSKKKKP